MALAVVCAGLLAYALWKLGQALSGRGPEGGGGQSAFDRISNAAGGIASYNPRDAVGVDGVLARVHGEPFGTVLLALVAAGLLVFACYSLFEARYRQL